jgi:hypothetical protein
MWRRQWRWIGVVLVVQLLERRLLHLLLLVKDLDIVLELCEPCFSLLMCYLLASA